MGSKECRCFSVLRESSYGSDIVERRANWGNYPHMMFVIMMGKDAYATLETMVQTPGGRYRIVPLKSS
jgi:hypothetical protein